MAANGMMSKLAKLQEKFSTSMEPKFTPSGSVIWDKILGGGIPEGVIIEVASPSGIGKST